MEGQKYFAATLGADVTKNAELPVFRQIMDWLDAYFEKRPPPCPASVGSQGERFPAGSLEAAAANSLW